MARLGKDITGQRFGHLTIIGMDGKNEHGQNLWLAKCDCGRFTHNIASRYFYGGRKYCSRECSYHVKEYVGKEFGDFVVVSRITDATVLVRCKNCGAEKVVHNNRTRGLSRCKCNPLYRCRDSLEYNGEIISRRELAKLIGISRQRLAQRIQRYGKTDLAYRPKGDLLTMHKEPIYIKKEFTDDELIGMLKLKVNGGVVYITRDICKQILQMIYRLNDVVDSKQDSKQDDK